MNELIKLGNENGIFISQDNSTQPKLHDNILLLMQKFKSAYETKDLTALKHTISDDFCGNFVGASSKKAMVNLFENYWTQLPRLLGLKLEIQIYHIIESSNSFYSGIVEFKTKLKIGPFPTKKTIESGKLYCEAKPDGILNTWRTSKIASLSENQESVDNILECCRAIGVNPDSSFEEIKIAYRKRIEGLHPDKVADRAPEIQKFANKQTQKLNYCYKKILDRKSRLCKVNNN